MSKTTEPSSVPGDSDGRDIDTEIAEIAGILNAQHGRLVAVVERALNAGRWKAADIHSPAQWLAWKAGLSPHRAKEIVRCAERRSEFPRVSSVFDRGQLAVDQVVAVMNAPAWADDHLAEFATVTTVSQLRKTMATQFFDEGPEPAPVEPATEQPDRLSTWFDESGRWRISGSGDVARGSIVDAALTEAKDALFERGNTDATWFDALVEISERSLDGVTAARGDRYRTWIHLDADTAHARTTSGRRIPDSVRNRILCDGNVQPVWEHDGVPFNVGRSQRIVPDRTRRVIERRDQGCRVPGCASTRFVEIHHIVHWIDGGTTDTSNLISLCSRHHRSHHDDRLGIAGNADNENHITFTDHHGRTIERGGRPKIPDRPPDVPDRGYEHPSGANMDYSYFTGWVHPDVLSARRSRHQS